MGAELVDPAEAEAPREGEAELTIAEQFRRALPYYMAMGVSPSDFWDGDCELAAHYREAYDIKQEQRNHELWLQGLYFNEAVSVALGNAFRKKGAKMLKYRDKPLPATKREARALDKEAESGSAQITKYNNMKARMQRVAAGVNTRFKRAGGAPENGVENEKEAGMDV